jgi:ATP-dependent RNA helicase DeaD
MIPESLQSVPEPLATALAKRGFSELTPVQHAVIEAVEKTQVDGKERDLRISSQTGSGKTVAFGLALAPHFLGREGADRAIEVLVIVPTRELVLQVCDELRWLYAGVSHVRVEAVMGGASILRERGALSRRPSIVVATPGRLLDHIRTRALQCDRISHVVLDEADRMLDMGFREELEAILEALPTPRRSHMASATCPESVRRLADRFQSDALRIEGTPVEDAHPDIEHVAHLVRPRDTHAALVNLLLLARGSRCLVFVKRRIDAAEVSEKLAADGFGALPLSGDLPQAQRTRTLNAFRNGSIDIVVATDVAARGIDVPGISTVIHLDTPFDSESYVHRSGRTGRAGSEGRSLMLVPVSQERRMRRLLSSAGITAQWLPAPGPKQVRKAARKQQRRELWEKLASENGPSEQQLEYAASLLEDHDPKAIVAALLDLATPALLSEPKELGPVSSGPVPTRQDKRDQDFVAFSISWGSRKGATASRVLSQVCRRGGVPGSRVGVIRVEPGRSTFQIARDAADAFEAKAIQPDKRDPGARIERLDAAQPPHRPSPGRRGHPARPQSKAKHERHARTDEPKRYGKGRPRPKAASK